MRVNTASWPDQREAGPQLDASVRTLARARACLVEAGLCVRDGWSWRYDVPGIKSDLRWRCSTDGCDGVALGASGKCSACHFSKPRVCPDCGGPKAHHAELCRECSAAHGKLKEVQEEAVAAKQRLHKQARERWRAEPVLTRAQTAGLLGTSYVPKELKPVRAEGVAGAAYNLYAEPQVVDFQKEWARGGDGRRRAWWHDPEHARRVLGRRSDLKAPAVLDAEQRARDRRAALTNLLRPGRSPLPESDRWAELYGQMFTGPYEDHAAELGERVLKPLARCLEVALLDWEENPTSWPDYQPAQLPRNAARRVYQALKRRGVV